MPQANIKETGKKGLKREFTITLDKQEVDKKFASRLESIGRTAQLPGFRPGKIPLAVLKQKFGPDARRQVIDRVVSEASQRVFTENNLRPAQAPSIELVTFGEDQDLEFRMAVEILPEITPPDFSKISLERLTTEVSDKTIDDTITRIVKSVRKPEAISEKRGAKKGDVVVLDFDGTVDGKPQPGMKGQGHSLELGSKSFIDTFEEQLEGLKPGDKKTVKVTFPADYHAANLAGKKAEFAVEIKELRAHKPIEMSDALALEVGMQTIDELKKRVRDDISADYGHLSRAIIKRHLLDKLADIVDFEVPPGMIETEFGSIWAQVEQAKKSGELPPEEAKKSEEQLKKDYRAIAERRIRLGLLLADVARREKIEVSSAELRNAMIAEAQRFPGQEKAIVDYYTQTEGALERLRAPLLEEKVVEHILSKAKVAEKKISAEELTKMPQEME